MTLVPAYGRDYKSRKEVVEALTAGKDFECADVFSGYCGSMCNLQDLNTQGIRTVTIRYAKLTKVIMVNIVNGIPK